MSSPHIHTYLNDHLAGSIAALELLDRMVGAASAPEEREFLTILRSDITADQQVLQSLIAGLGAEESSIRKAGAWLTEKFGELKLLADDPGGSGLRHFEALETLALGIQGKLALWTALEAIRGQVAEVGAIDLPRLKQRAQDQHERVEARRLAAARHALTAPL